jgi:hypothetical protein
MPSEEFTHRISQAEFPKKFLKSLQLSLTGQAISDHKKIA